MPFDADTLRTFVVNERRAHEKILYHVRGLRDTIDRAARSLAQFNADWHDDPAAEDHAAHHAPADEQFPREVRDEAIRELVAHYLTEITLFRSKRDDCKTS